MTRRLIVSKQQSQGGTNWVCSNELGLQQRPTENARSNHKHGDGGPYVGQVLGWQGGCRAR